MKRRFFTTQFPVTANMRVRTVTRLLALALGLSLSQAGLGAITFQLDQEYSGGATPSGPLTASFESVASNTVQLTVDLAGLSGGEFLSRFYFNYDPGPAVPLTFTHISGDAALSILQCTDGTGCSNDHRAGPDGFFDVVFNFERSSGARFEADDELVYNIAGSGLTESMFHFESVGGNKGAFFAAAHVQGIGPNAALSGWVGAVPEVGNYAMLLAGLALLGFAARRRPRPLAGIHPGWSGMAS